MNRCRAVLGAAAIPCRMPTIREFAGAPDLLSLHRRAPARYPHLLESAARGEPLGRHDILFAFPGESLTLNADASLSGPHAGESFLSSLDQWIASEQASGDASLPFTGGWFVYLGYELAAEIEPRLRQPRDARWPVARATRFPAAVIRDHLGSRTWLVAENEEFLDRMHADLVQLADSVLEPVSMTLSRIEEDEPARYERIVERAIRYVHAGDVFQANLSREWRASLPEAFAHWQLYNQLRRANPAPFAALVTWGEQAIISSSPERLVEIRGEHVQTRPIAGTRPRSANADEDRAMLEELIGHPKERAEHVMLIDLERNDLGRIALPGSVDVNELMALESYAHVHHIVSNVRARRRPDASAGDVLRAVFPGGTITGCPKVRCMEIIAELEQAPRLAYTGSLGYLNRDGSGDFNILIRTMMRDGDSLFFRAGAGIVADSIPSRELEETRAKARGMLRALGDVS